MRSLLFVSSICCTLLFISCKVETPVPGDFILSTTAKNNAVVNGGELTLSLKAKRSIAVDSINYSLEGENLGTATQMGEFVINPKSKKLGHKTLQASIYTPKGMITVKQQIILLHRVAPKIYGYKIVNRYPHRTDSYTQGLEFVGDKLFESAGSYGKSKLRAVDYKTGEVLKEYLLDNAYFAEGLTVHNNKIYQLTWQENLGFIYDANSFEKIGTFTYDQSKEGWGLCNDGTSLYKSDGTTKIWKLDSKTVREQSYIEPTDNVSVKTKFNELEWINGKIYANTYQKAAIAIIDPNSGAIEGVIDLRSIVKEVQDGLDKQNEVLNGIAYKKNEDRLFVTGKHWNTLFEIEVIDK